MAVKKTIIIEADTAKAVDGIDDVNESLDETSKGQAEVEKGFSVMDTRAGKFVTTAVQGFKSVLLGIKSTIRSMGVLKVAIAATGIGALVIAFGALTSFFTKTQRGADKINQVFKTVGATVDVLIDRLSTFGEGLFQIISGNFKEGFETLKGSLAGVVDEIKNESQAALQLEKDFQKLQDREIEFIKVQAEKRRAIEQARLAAEDESKTDEQRADALREAIRIQNELTDEQIAIEEERARIIRERVALGESTREDLEEQARAEARVIELQTERDRRLRSVQTRLNAFTKGVKDNTKAEEKNADAKEKEAEAQRKANEERQKAIDQLLQQSQLNSAQALQDALLQADALEEEFLNKSLDRQTREENAIRDKYFAAIEAAKEAGRDITNLEKAQEEELNAVRQRYAKQDLDQQQMVQNAKVQLTQMALSAILSNLESGSAAAKAIAVAQTTYDTYQAIQSTFASAAANPTSILFPAQPYIQAGVAAAFGFANIRRILSTKPASPSGGVVGGSIPSGSGGVQSPSVSFNTLQGGFNQVTDAIQGQNNRPVQAYVTQQSIDNGNQLKRKIVGQASFG